MPGHTAQSKSAGLRQRARAIRRRAAPVLSRIRGTTARHLRPVISVVTSLGWTLLLLCVLCSLLAAKVGWVEMAVAAGACALLLVVGLPFLIGPTHLEVTATVEPVRVTVGETLTGHITVKNLAKAPLLSAQVNFPIGTSGVSYDLPTLLPGAVHHTDPPFFVPTQRRGVISVGPVTSVRGDPLGIYRREVSWTERTEVFVHPRVTPLAPLGAGLIRDLEGTSSQHVSTSDLSFHALREYVPGDDLRHVHWLSTAKRGDLLVRQYLDTRRSHLTAIVDSNAASYRSEDDYETAISVAASVIVRAMQDDYDVSFLSGGAVMTKRTGKRALDACSRAVLESFSLTDVAAKATRLAPDTSLALFITGPGPEYLNLQRAASQFSVETDRLVLRVDSQSTPSLRTRGDMPVLTISRLEELGLVLRWGLA